MVVKKQKLNSSKLYINKRHAADYVSCEMLVYFSIMIVVHRVEVSACENQIFFFCLLIVGEMIFEEMGNFNQYLYSLETSVQQQKESERCTEEKKKCKKKKIHARQFFFFFI